MTSEDEDYAQARKALEVLRKAAWKGDLRGVDKAMAGLQERMDEVTATWAALQDRHLAYQQVRDGEIDGSRTEFKDDLQDALNVFDEALKALLGPSEYEAKMLADG